jgi:PleD family two-component response regulator
MGATFTLTLTIVAQMGDVAVVEGLGPVSRVVGIAEGRPVPTMLIADDQPLNRQVLRELLEIPGINVVEAENGAVAVERFAEVSPDLVFMDVKMPVMDGIEAVRRLKATRGG